MRDGLEFPYGQVVPRRLGLRSKSCYQKLNSGHRSHLHLGACFSGVVALAPPAVVGAGGSGCFPMNTDWTTPGAFPLIPPTIACLSSSNYRSVFSSIAATYACSSYHLRASTGFCSRYVGGMGVWTARKDSSTNSVMNEGGGSGVSESTYKSRTTAQREARLR